MRVVLDTSAYICYGQNHAGVIRVLENAETIFLPAVALAELLTGFHKGRRFRSNRRQLERVIRELEIDLIAEDRKVAEQYALVYDNLRRRRKPIPTNDIWISASCMTVRGTLLTTDGHFREVVGLEVKLLRSA